MFDFCVVRTIKDNTNNANDEQYKSYVQSVRAYI